MLFLKRQLVFIALLISGATFAAPPLINYQGFLTDAGGQPLNDVTSVTFRIWTKLDAASSTVASDLVWAEKHESVSVVDGRINVILGNGTPVQIDLTVATNAVDNLGEAFREDATYIGITVNDANDQYDPGEEVTPRQQLLSVPYALNSAGSTLRISGYTLTGSLFEEDGTLTESEATNKVVEVDVLTKEIRLSVDIPGQEDTTLRGVYLGGGLIQTAGIVKYVVATLDPGAFYYLTSSTDPVDAGTVTKDPPVIPDSDPELLRPIATMVGIAQSNSTLQLKLGAVQVLSPIIPDDNLLVNGGIDGGTTVPWAMLGGGTPAVRSGRGCGGSDAIEGRDDGSGGIQPYQNVNIDNALYPLVDSGMLGITFSAEINWLTTTSATSASVAVDFFDAQSNAVPGGDRATVNRGQINVCQTASKSIVIPPQARRIRVRLSDSGSGNNTEYDNMVLKYVRVSELNFK